MTTPTPISGFDQLFDSALAVDDWVVVVDVDDTTMAPTGTTKKVSAGALIKNHPNTHVLVGTNAFESDRTVDFLDPGDGSGLASAMALAAGIPGGAIVELCPGTYDFTTTGAALLPLVVPDNVVVQGTGSGTEILGNDTNRQVFTLGNFSTLRDLRITMPAAGGAPNGTEVISYGSVNIVENLRVDFTAAPPATETLTALFGTAGGAGLFVNDCRFICGPEMHPNRLHALPTFYIFRGDVSNLFVARCITYGMEGIMSGQVLNSAVTQSHFSRCGQEVVNISVTGFGGPRDVVFDSTVIECREVTTFGMRLDGVRHKFISSTLIQDIFAAGGVGLRIIGDENTLSSSVIQGFDGAGLDITATANRTTYVGNVLYNNGSSVADAGTLTVSSANQL